MSKARQREPTRCHTAPLQNHSTRSGRAVCLRVVKYVDNVRQLEDSALLRLEIGFATLFLVILVIRYVYATKTQRSALSPEAGRFQQMAARLVHLGIYAGLESIAVTGLLIALLF